MLVLIQSDTGFAPQVMLVKSVYHFTWTVVLVLRVFMFRDIVQHDLQEAFRYLPRKLEAFE